MALNTAGASRARLLISREIVGSEATRPKTAGSDRIAAASARQSPPNARVIARSDTILPGSWVANGLRHRSNAFDNPWVRPVTTAVRVSSMPPAWPTTREAPASWRGWG